MTTYNLPTVTKVCGTFHITVYSDTVISAPTIQTIKSIGKSTEAANVSIQEQEIARMTLKVMLDDGGFWVGMLYTPSTFLITLTEADSVERFVFYGQVEQSTVDWSSATNISGTRTGDVTFNLLSLIQAPLNLATTDWITEVLLRKITFGSAPGSGLVWSVMSVRGLFSAMLSKAFPDQNPYINPATFLGDTTFIRGTQDLFFKTGAAADRDVSQLYIPVSWDDAGNSINMAYFKAGDAENLSNTYATMKDLIGVIARNFGLRVTMTYDFSAGRFKFNLLQAYRAYSGTLDFSARGKAENQSVSTDLVGDAAIVRYQRDATKYVWLSHKASNMAFYVVDPSTFKGLTFDFDTTLIWHVMSGTEDNAPERLLSSNSDLVPGDSHASLEVINNVTWHDYQNSSDEVATDPSSSNLKLEQAIAGYNGKRFININWFKNTLKYGRVTASEGGLESFSNIGLLKRQALSLGFGAGNKNYFCNRYTIDFDSSEVQIEWLQEEK